MVKQFSYNHIQVIIQITLCSITLQIEEKDVIFFQYVLKNSYLLVKSIKQIKNVIEV